MKKTLWQPIVLGVIMGLLAGVATVTGLTFLAPGITDNAIGFYVTLFLLAAALGGPQAGVIAALLFVIIVTFYGPLEIRAVISIPEIFWSNLVSLIVAVSLVAIAYRLIFEHLKMPLRLLAWAGIVIAYYIIAIPSSIIPQYLLLENPISDILPAVLEAYRTFVPQAIFDFIITSLIFIALPSRYRRPLWYEAKKAPDDSAEIQGE